ncbi:MAG: hypothetical protein Q4A74_08175 [Cardiobacteriaceae bacterium]|nr:hypothetical protein [Cardiobacteriaceae bacterium]
MGEKFKFSLKIAKENLTKILSSLSKAQANVSKAKETLGMLEEVLYKLENATKLLNESEENFTTTKTKLLIILTKLKYETERLEFLEAQMPNLQETRQIEKLSQNDANQSLPIFSLQGTFVGYSKHQSVMESKDKQIVNNQEKNLPDTGSDTSLFTLLFGASLTFIG